MYILKRGTSWKKLELPETRRNELEPSGTSWDNTELVKNSNSKNSHLSFLLKDKRTEVVL